MKNVPHKLFSRTGLRFLVSGVGELKRLHLDTELCKSFDEAKVLVQADLNKPLPKTFRFKSQKGVDAEVSFEYPWLPPRCTSCNKWGHVSEVCVMHGGVQFTLMRRPANNLEPKPQSSSPQTKVSNKRSDTEQPILQQHKGSEQSNLTQSMVVETEPTINLAKEAGNPQVFQDLETVIDTSKTGEEENWQTVSPGKIGRETTDQISPVGISPSKFSVLEDQEETSEGKDKEDDDQLEEGEVVIQYKEEEDKVYQKKSKVSKTEEQGKRTRHPRAMTGTNAKGIPPNAGGKRGKKH